MMIPAIVYYAVALIGIVIGAVVIKWALQKKSSKTESTVPGLSPTTPDDGNLLDIRKAGSLHQFLMKLHAKYGPIAGFWWGKTHVVSIADSQLFKQHSNVSDKPAVLFTLFEPVFGSASLQYANGLAGRYRRQHYDHAFAHERLVTLYETFQKEANIIEQKWLQKTEQDYVASSEDMFTYAIRCSLNALMGETFKDEKLVQSFRSAYDKAWNEMELRYVDPVLPPDNSPRIMEFKEALAFLKSSVKQIVEHRKEHNLSQQGNLLIDDILDYAPSEEAVTCDALTYMIASFHTSGYLLTWCFYYLAMNRDIQMKVYKEVTRVLGDKNVAEDNIMRLRYTTQVLDETMRCAVIAPWGARVQEELDTELGGHMIPRNTPVIHAFGVVLQDEAHWPQPKKFDPDRFTPDKVRERSSFAFPPFGFAGRRKCPGNKFAYLEATVLLATLIRKFKISVWDDQIAKPVYGFVTHPQEEVWLKISKRT